jgi:hypothetical protein
MNGSTTAPRSCGRKLRGLVPRSQNGALTACFLHMRIAAGSAAEYQKSDSSVLGFFGTLLSLGWLEE